MLTLRSFISIARTYDSSNGKINNQSKTEDLLRQRIENLLDTLDSVVQTSDARHKESKELTDELKRANR